MGSRVAVNVSVTKMVEGAPDIKKETLLGAFITDDSIPAAIVDGATNGFNQKCDQYYFYGRDHYVEGLPGRATFSAGAPALSKRDAVISILEGIEGEPIRIAELDVRNVNLQALAKEWLQDTPGQDWDSFKQSLTVDGQKYYVNQAVNEGGFLTIKLSLLNQRVNRLFGISEFGNISVTTDIPQVSTDEIYYHVVYFLESDPYHSRILWNYKYSLNTYPTLDIGTDVISGSSFMPIAPIRRNKVNVVDDNSFNVNQKKSVQRLLSKIDVDLDDMTESLNDPDDPDNLENVDEVFVMFAMDFDSDEPISLAYMYESFRTFHINEDTTQAEWLAWWNLDEETRESTPRPKNAIYMSDSSVSMQLEWNFTTITVKSGLVSDGAAAPDPFTVAPAFTPTPYGPQITDDIVKVVVVDSVNTELEYNDERQQMETKLPKNDDDDVYNTHSIIYRRQLTRVADGDASDTYEELLVHGALATYDVYRGSAKGRGEFVRDVTSMSDGGFILPVSHDVVGDFNGFDESQVYYESLKVIVYAVKIKHLKWYQSGLFGVFIAVVAIVIAVITQQPWVAFAGLTGASAVAAFILVTIAAGFVVTKAFEVIASVVGGELALILAAIIAVVAVTFGDTKVLGKLITAEDFLMLANSAFSAANSQISKEISDILIEGIEAQRELDELTEDLQEREDAEFGDVTAPELYDIIGPRPEIEFNMNIERWHEHKIGIGNPGVLVLDLPRTYHEIALAIPETVQRPVNEGTTLKGV